MLYKQYPRYGDNIGDTLPYDFFSECYSDWLFVLEAMQKKNWLDVEIRKMGDGKFAISDPFLITQDGWFEIEKELEMSYSKQVFVAMWFDKSMDKAAKKIEEAIKDCGLKVMRIDRKEHNNEISGEILFEIINSRIVIADVTGQRNGVYFEAGFAHEQQKSVIWSCQSDDLKNVHFDTRQYNHIKWDNEDDLYTKLKDRILATLAIESR
jgi:nucleoside 2-deoxyribosyltransferase